MESSQKKDSEKCDRGQHIFSFFPLGSCSFTNYIIRVVFASLTLCVLVICTRGSIYHHYFSLVEGCTVQYTNTVNVDGFSTVFQQ